jgi:N-acetylneuraminic acid mutarotase
MGKNAFTLLVLMLSLLAATILSSEANITSTAQPTSGIADNEHIGNSWIKKAGIPQGGSIYALSVIDERIYAFGGYPYDGRLYSISGEYAPSTDTWTAKTPMRQPRIRFATAVYDNKIFVIGGERDAIYSPACKTVEVFDPVTDVWTYATPMPEPRSQMCANVVNGKIYVIGGTTSPTPNITLDEGITNTTMVYDPDTGTWTTEAEIPEAISNYASTVFEDRIFVFGGLGIFITPAVMNGYRVDIVPTNNTYIYDPKTNVWSLGEQLPYRLAGAVACASTGVMATKGIYIFGGAYADYGGHLELTQVYDPISNSWINGTIIPETQGYYRAVALDDTIYVMGGMNTNQTPWLGNPYSPPPPLTSINYQYFPFGYGTFEPFPTLTPLVTPSQVGLGCCVLLVLAFVVLVLGVLIAGLVLRRSRRKQR